MTDEIKANKALARGMRAQALLENELLTEAFKTLEDAYIATWRATAVHEEATREKLFIAINVLGKVKQHIQAVVADGQLAQKELADLASVTEPRRRWGVI